MRRNAYVFIMLICLALTMVGCGKKDLPTDNELLMIRSDLEDEIEDICKKNAADYEVLVEQNISETGSAILYSFDITLTVNNFKSMSADRAFVLVKDMEDLTVSGHEHKDAYYSTNIAVYDSSGIKYYYDRQKSGNSYFEYVMCGGHSVITAKNGNVIWSDYK